MPIIDMQYFQAKILYSMMRISFLVVLSVLSISVSSQTISPTKGNYQLASRFSPKKLDRSILQP
jgi:energy-coupling factor transporter transmembrane protein EcfT